jgi:hypothetical protein
LSRDIEHYIVCPIVAPVVAVDRDLKEPGPQVDLDEAGAMLESVEDLHR